MTETWNFINTGSHDPYYNMAMDEALLNFVSRGKLTLLSDFTLESCNVICRVFSKIKERN